MNTQHEGAVRVMTDTIPQVSPEKIKTQQEYADRVMKGLLEEDEKEMETATTGAQKKSNKKKTRGQGRGGSCEVLLQNSFCSKTINTVAYAVVPSITRRLFECTDSMT